MDAQMISTTYLQRNFGRVVDGLSEPITVLRDSEPDFVIIKYKDFLRMRMENEKRKDDEFFAMLDDIHARNAHITEKELDKDIDEAFKYVRSHRRRH